MNSPARQAKLQELIELIRSKMEEIKRANERDAVFEDKKRLYLELKELNSQLSDVLSQVDYSEK